MKGRQTIILQLVSNKFVSCWYLLISVLVVWKWLLVRLIAFVCHHVCNWFEMWLGRFGSKLEVSYKFLSVSSNLVRIVLCQLILLIRTQWRISGYVVVALWITSRSWKFDWSKLVGREQLERKEFVVYLKPSRYQIVVRGQLSRIHFGISSKLGRCWIAVSSQWFPMNWVFVRSSFGKGSLFVRSWRVDTLTIGQDFSEVSSNTGRC